MLLSQLLPGLGLGLKPPNFTCPSEWWGSAFSILLPGTHPLQEEALCPGSCSQHPIQPFSCRPHRWAGFCPTSGRTEPALSGHLDSVCCQLALLASDIGGLQPRAPGCWGLPQCPQLLFQSLVAAVHVQIAPLDLPLVAQHPLLLLLPSPPLLLEAQRLFLAPKPLLQQLCPQLLGAFPALTASGLPPQSRLLQSSVSQLPGASSRGACSCRLRMASRNRASSTSWAWA